jgi:SPP1 family predicted phage head-tail adaptor
MPTPTLQAGKLRHRIKIVEPTLAQDSFGGTAIDVARPVATVWASVETLAGREIEAAQALVGIATHKITMRWQRGIRAKQNVWWEDRQFQIQYVDNPDGIHHVLVLICIEREDSTRQEGGGTA